MYRQFLKSLEFYIVSKFENFLSFKQLPKFRCFEYYIPNLILPKHKYEAIDAYRSSRKVYKVV